MKRKEALKILKLTEAAAGRPGRIERRLELIRSSYGETDPEKVERAEAAAELLLYPDGPPGWAERTAARLWWLRLLGPRMICLLLVLGGLLVYRYLLPWIHAGSALGRVPVLLRDITAESGRLSLDALETRTGRVLLLAGRSVEGLAVAPGEAGERHRARWQVELDRLLQALLERSFLAGRKGRKEDTRRLLALYRDAHRVRTRVQAVEVGEVP